MCTFLQQHGKLVSGMLSGWDRLRFRGTLGQLCHPGGLNAFLHLSGRLFKEFKEFAVWSSTQLKEAAMQAARRLDRPVIYLSSSKVSKEEIAKQHARDERITSGLICCISAVEPCSSFVIRKNPSGDGFDFQRAPRRCQHMYHYYMHPIFGFMHVRLQTWLPFDQFICINGREWLGRTLDQAGVRKYLRKENCFLQLDDVAQAQRILDEQVEFDWKPALDKIAHAVAPTLGQLLAPVPMSYYWTIMESEWAGGRASPPPRTSCSTEPRIYRGCIRTCCTMRCRVWAAVNCCDSWARRFRCTATATGTTKARSSAIWSGASKGFA
jgi:hypothetical protein